MCYIDATVKGFWDAIPAYVLLSKNFQNAVWARYVTKIPLTKSNGKDYFNSSKTTVS
jgi:hypothetical protein